MAQNQTISFLTRRFAEIGIRPDARKGQNFLIDMNLLRLLADASELSRDDVVLEVGTGTGALTQLLAARAGAVVTVEVDQHLHQLARELMIDDDNVTLLLMDALRNKNHFDDRVEQTVRERLSAIPDGRFKLCANLPYSVATPVITNLLAWDVVPDSMTVTIQKELADRIVAAPGTKDYGSLSIWMQSQCDAEIVRVLPPSVFWPRPKVNSAIIRLRIDRERRSQIPNLAYFHQFVRAMFIHRRKFLRSNLVPALKDHLGKVEVDEILAEMDFGPETRAETIPWPTFLTFAEAVRRRAPDWRL